MSGYGAVERMLDAMNRKATVAEAFLGHCSKIVERREIDHVALGYMLRKRRIAQSVSLRAHAAKLKLSAPYVSDLELGRRGWSLARVEAYLGALPEMPDAPSLQIR